MIHNFMMKFLRANDNPECKMTVFSDSSAPQFMVYNKTEAGVETLVPMEEENAPALESGEVNFKKVNWKEMFMRFFKTVLNFLKNFLAKRNAD
jgi:hypothetical protein